jgi:hypothetical protein
MTNYHRYSNLKYPERDMEKSGVEQKLGYILDQRLLFNETIFTYNCYSRYKKGEIHKSHNKAYNDNLWTEIETLQWLLAQILMLLR